LDTIIVTHGDLDGISAASIVYSYLQKKSIKNIRVEISQPFELYEVLNRIIHDKPKRIYIIDISIDEVTWSKTKEILRRLRENKAKIIWIDHHSSTVEKAEELAELGITLIFSLDGSAATITKQIYLPETQDPEFYKKIAIIGEVGDKVIKLEPNNPLNQIIETVGSALVAKGGDNELRYKLLRLWTREKQLLDDDIAQKAEEAIKQLARLIREAKNKVIYDDEKLMVIDLRGVRVKGYVGKVASHYMQKTGKTTIVIFQIKPTEIIITCRVPSNVEFNAAKILPEIARKYGGGGGGHPKAASIRIPASTEQTIKNIINDINAQIKTNNNS